MEKSMDRETASEFSRRIELVFTQIGAANELLRNRLTEGDLRRLADIWGRIIQELDFGILEVIYRAHPDLRPEGYGAGHSAFCRALYFRTGTRIEFRKASCAPVRKRPHRRRLSVADHLD